MESQEDLEILLADYNKKKLGTSKVSETEIKTQNGTVNVKQYGLLKSPVRKDRSLACTECDVKKTTIAELTKHIKQAHPVRDCLTLTMDIPNTKTSIICSSMPVCFA